MSELLGKLNQEKKDIIECSLLPEYLAELLQLIERGTISGKIAKAIFEEMYATGNPPTSIVEEKGLVQITDETALEEIGKSIIKQYPKEVAQYRRGKEKLFGFFVGQMMKQTKGKANPQMANKIFKRLLER
jgi:aspartyl-tRNA(Asn)/glutamyl-tRNA(Gln) amidotransferase subunit B